MEASDELRIAIIWSGGGVDVNGSDTANYTVTADATISIIADVWDGNTLHFYYADGNLQDPSNITITMGVNGTVITLTTGFSGGIITLGLVGNGNDTNTMSHLYEFNGNRIPNSTVAWRVTAENQVFSFSMTVYLVNIQGLTPDGLANAWDIWTVNMTLSNQSVTFEIQSNSAALITLNYIGNGTNSCVAHWENIIVNASLDCSFTADGTINMILQIQQDIDGIFRVGRDQTTVGNFNFTAADGILQFNLTGVSGIQTIVILHLGAEWTATTESRLINASDRVEFPGELIGTRFTDSFSAGAAGPTLIAYSYSQVASGPSPGSPGSPIFGPQLPPVEGAPGGDPAPSEIPLISSGTLLISAALVLVIIIVFSFMVKKKGSSSQRTNSFKIGSGSRRS